MEAPFGLLQWLQPLELSRANASDFLWSQPRSLQDRERVRSTLGLIEVLEVALKYRNAMKRGFTNSAYKEDTHGGAPLLLCIVYIFIYINILHKI